MNELANRLTWLVERKLYWLGWIAFCLALEVAALFYQYKLNYGPCVLCIHVRIILMGIFLVSIVGFYTRHKRIASTGVNIAMTMLLVFLLERSYQLLGIERGFITGSCSFDSGLPGWFTIDKWFPFMFEILESCGYTPVLLFGITMAESLLVLSGGLLLLSSMILISQFHKLFRK